MEKLYNFKKSLVVADVFNKIINNTGYATVSELATFLNAFCGTYSITGAKINKLLEIEEYQEENEDSSNAKFVATETGKAFCKIDTITIDNKQIKRLIWNPRIIFEALDVNLSENNLNILRKITSNIGYYEIINYYTDDYDYDILEENIKYLKEEFKKVGN